jgi:vancomycin resistance protein VanJ
MRRHSLLLLSLANLFSLILIWGLQNFIGEQTGPTALLTYVPQHGFGVLSAILIFASFRAKRKGWLALNCFSFVFFAFALLGFEVPTPSAGNEKTIRVMTYNVLGAYADAEEIAREIRAQNPDIVCLQESGYDFGDKVAAKFPDWHSRSENDVTTLSHYPLLSSEKWPFRGTRNILETRWQTPQGTLRVLNVHIATNLDNERSRRSRIKQILVDAKPSAMARLEQLPYVDDASNKTPYKDEPTVLCGDFNTPPRGLFYRALRSEWDEAFAQTGFGLGLTYSRKRPLLRIDYIWMKNGIRSKRTFVPDVNGSDHFPVVSDLIMPQ